MRAAVRRQSPVCWPRTRLVPSFACRSRVAAQTKDHLCLVLDYIEGGNMYSDLMRGPYTHERACFYAAQIVLATQHLHVRAAEH